MKQLLLLVIFLSLSTVSLSQSGIAKLNFGDMAHFEDVSVEFLELISDSRCPKSVQCIRAGEAIVLVAIYRNGEFLHEKKLIFDASGLVRAKDLQVFNSDYLSITGLALYPYPITTNKINPEDYCLDLRIN